MIALQELVFQTALSIGMLIVNGDSNVRRVLRNAPRLIDYMDEIKSRPSLSATTRQLASDTLHSLTLSEEEYMRIFASHCGDHHGQQIEVQTAQVESDSVPNESKHVSAVPTSFGAQSQVDVEDQFWNSLGHENATNSSPQRIEARHPPVEVASSGLNKQVLQGMPSCYSVCGEACTHKCSL